MKDKLKHFLAWLEKEDIARWYFIDEEASGEGADNIVARYLKELN